MKLVSLDEVVEIIESGIEYAKSDTERRKKMHAKASTVKGDPTSVEYWKARGKEAGKMELETFTLDFRDGMRKKTADLFEK